MSDAVVRVQAHLREIAREDWDALEDKHARNLTWLRAELEQVARSLDVRGVKLEIKRPAPALFISDYGLPLAHKKRKLSVATRVSVNETRTGASVDVKPDTEHAPTEDGAVSNEPIDLANDEAPEQTASSAHAGAVQASSSTTDSEHDDGDDNADGEHVRAARTQSEDGNESDKRKSRKRGRTQTHGADPLHMRVVDLRSELRNRGLRATGNKPELLNRLLNAMTADDKKTNYSSHDNPVALEHIDEEDAGAVSHAEADSHAEVSHAEESHADEASDAEADDNERGPASANVSKRESDSDMPNTKDSTSHEEETDVAPAPSDAAHTEVERTTEAESEVDEEEERATGFSTAGHDRQADLVNESSSSHEVADSNKPSTKLVSSEASLKVVPTSAASSVHESPQKSVADLQLDSAHVAENAGDSLALSIRSDVAEPTSSSLQAASHTTPRDRSVPSSYASPANTSDETRRDDTQHQEDEEKMESTMPSEESTHATAAAAPQAPVPGSVSWLHSRAKEAFKAFTESRIDASGNTTSLLARGFRAFQDAIVPESATDTSHASNEQLSQSASKVPSTRSRSPADPDSTPRPSLRATTSLPASERLPSLKVSFADNDEVDTISEESRTDDSTLEDTSASNATGFVSTTAAESFNEGRARSASLPKAELSQNGVHKLAKTPDSSLSSSGSSRDDVEKAKSAEADKSDEARRKREFQESVDREAQRLRMAAKLSAQKRLEQAKATKTFWEQREQLKLSLQMSAESSTLTSNSRAVETGASAPSSAAKEAASVAVNGSLASAESERAQTTSRLATTSVPATASVETNVGNNNVHTLTATVATKAATASSTASSSTRPRADSMSSTVSSVSSSTSSTKALTSTSTTTNGTRRALSNLVSGIHSFTSLIDSSKETSSSSTTRNVPVVNSLKLAEKTRQLEKKKEEDRVKRKEALMRKYEEQRKLDERKKADDKKKREAQKEKAEREAKQKRDQERIEAKKKRELELAHKRHEKLQQMKERAAKLAAEKEKARTTGNTTMKAPAPSSSSHANGAAQLVPPPRPTKPRPAKVDRLSSSKSIPKPVAPSTTSASASSTKAAVALASTTVNKKQPAVKEHAEATAASYDMSDHCDSDSDGISADDDDDEAKCKRRRRDGKDIPTWAQRENLDKILREQFGPNAIDPSPSIFPDFADTCDLEAIFDSSDARRKKRFGRRTSSGNWFGDRPTARDRALYRRDMGFNR